MNVLGISAGNGVMLYPFKKHVIANIELRNDYTTKGNADQFHLNFPLPLFTKHLDIPSIIHKKVDILIGHPKCGASSMLALSRAKKFKSHKEEPSLTLFLEGVSYYEPKVFLLENLPKLLESYSMDDLAALFPNYMLDSWIGTMDRLGNSQVNRNRLIITGVKKTRSKRGDKIRAALLKKFKVATPGPTGNLLTNLPRNGHFRPPMDEIIALYGGTQMSYTAIQKLWWDLRPATRIKTPAESFNTAPGVYRDLWDKPPSTIRKSNRCFNPDGLSYTPRERARIQGIPDSFKIMDTSDYYNQKTLFNKGCITTGSTPCYEVGLWFYEALKTVFTDL